jgi:hypothetical protein
MAIVAEVDAERMWQFIWITFTECESPSKLA